MLELDKALWTIPEAVRAQAQRYGDRVFCTFYNGEVMTFADLENETNALASGLAALGVGPQDRVLALALNSKAFLLAWVATMKRGAIFVPINTELKGAFLEHQVRNAEPKLVMVDAELRPSFDSMSFTGLSVETTVSLSGDVTPLPGSTLRSFAQISQTTARAEDIVPCGPQTICTIMFTSGTTGPSKGVLMPQGHCYLFGAQMARSFEMTPEDKMFICMPFFHAMGLTIQFIGCLTAGTPAHVTRRFSATSWVDDIRESEATITFGLGVIPEFIYRQPPRPEDRDHRLRKMVAVPVSDEWGPAFEERFGVKLLQGYGMTECNIPVWYDLNDDLVGGCAGPVIDEFFEVRIVDAETDEFLAVGEVGEIVIRPKEPSCFMMGYFRMPERTVDAWRNLWFHSGDAGRFDDRGRLHFVDRIKDCIRRRGENISSYEIEQVLNEHAGVAESAVVGVRVEGAGGEEEIKACVVVHGNSPEPTELLDWCVPRMPRYAVPRYIEFVSDLDKTQTGKLRKQDLREGGVTPATWDRESIGYVVPR
jgi:crotonobetaine/carnitine-CoA ligase